MSPQPFRRPVDISDHDTPRRPQPLSRDSVLNLLGADEFCDGCGARAQAVAVLASGSQLFFCGHHNQAHRDALALTGARVYDVTLATP